MKLASLLGSLEICILKYKYKYRYQNREAAGHLSFQIQIKYQDGHILDTWAA